MKLFAITLVAIAGLAVACTGLGPDGGPSSPAAVSETPAPASSGDAAEPQSTATPEPARQEAESPCGGSLEGCFGYDEMDQYVNAVLPLVVRYFETAYEGVPGPRDVVYIPNGRVARTFCGVSDSQAYEYCTGDRTVYVGQDLVWAFYRGAGDAAPAVALAHEFGHHLQNVMDVPFARTQAQAIAFENQADCVSGAWAAYADEQGWLEPEDDIADVETLMRFIGSRESRARDHGTSAERAEAFEAGFSEGITACNAYFPHSPIG